MFLSYVHIDVAGKPSSVLITLLQLLSSLNNIFLPATLVLSGLPRMNRRIEFRLDSSILIDLINTDQLPTIFVEFLDLIKSWV